MTTTTNDQEDRRKTVLVVDDDALLRRTLAGYLEDQPYNVLLAADGDEALAELERSRVDVVITDILMPNREGIETIIQIRSSGYPLRLIAMSGGARLGTVDYLEIAERLGADAVLHKPFSRAQFLATLEGDGD